MRSYSIIDNYSKEQLEFIVQNSNSYAEVLHKLGFKTKNGRNHTTLKSRLKELNISTDHFRLQTPEIRTYDNVFCENSTATQKTLRSWYLKINPPSKCEICGQDKRWNGKELVLTLDHIDGHNHNNVESNLRWICPNCASQLPTFAGRNLHKSNMIKPFITQYTGE